MEFLSELIASTPVSYVRPGDDEVDELESEAEAATDADVDGGSALEDEDEEEEEGAGDTEVEERGSGEEDEAMDGLEGPAAAGVAAAAAAADSGGAEGVVVRRKVQRALDYVRGLLWTLSMYFAGGERGGFMWRLPWALTIPFNRGAAGAPAKSLVVQDEPDVKGATARGGDRGARSCWWPPAAGRRARAHDATGACLRAAQP
jgi:hypothetical protein